MSLNVRIWRPFTILQSDPRVISNPFKISALEFTDSFVLSRWSINYINGAMLTPNTKWAVTRGPLSGLQIWNTIGPPVTLHVVTPERQPYVYISEKNVYILHLIKQLLLQVLGSRSVMRRGLSGFPNSWSKALGFSTLGQFFFGYLSVNNHCQFLFRP